MDIEGDQVQDDSTVEITDLGLPDGDTLHKSMSLPNRWFLSWQRSFSRKRVRLTMALCLLVLVLLVVFLSLSAVNPLIAGLGRNISASNEKQPLPIDIRPSVSILPQNDGFACMADAAWSNDTKYLAFVGYQKSCTLLNNQYEPGLVAIYNAFSGRLIGHFKPDSAILSALKTRFAQVHGVPVIYYNQISWSSSQQRLALTFSVFYLFQPAPALISNFYGVLLTDRGGTPRKVLLQPQKNNVANVEWDLARGVELDTPVITPGASPIARTSPSLLVYTWGENGSLLLAAQQTTHTTPSRTSNDYVGNPDGGKSFSIWQPGWVGLTTQTEQGKVHLPGAYSWNSYFAAWSPDGRYLVDNVTVMGRFELTDQPQLTSQALVDLHMEHLSLLSVRDIALLHVLKTLTGAPTNLSRQLIAWHPDGRTLAAYDNGTMDLDLYDCSTGYQVASLLLPTNASMGLVGFNTQLQWSPDGTRLFMLDQQVGSLVIWNIKPAH